MQGEKDLLLPTRAQDAHPSRELSFSEKAWLGVEMTLMTVLFAVMGISVYVVTHHKALEKDMYKVSVWYMMQSIVFYLFGSAIVTGRRLMRAGLPFTDIFMFWWTLAKPSVSGWIGACWGLNYVCILVAGTYLPNAIQTIFGQASTVMVYIISVQVYRHTLQGHHHFIVGVIVTLNLATAFGGSFTVSDAGNVTGGRLVFWCLVFLVNSLAGGLANNLLEAFFRVVKDDKDRCGTFDRWDYNLGINACAGLWSLVITIPLFLLAWAAYGDEVWERVFRDWSSFHSGSGQMFIAIMGISSWLYTILSYDIITKTSALWMTVTSQIATVCQIAFLAYPQTAGPYTSAANGDAWATNGTLAVVSLGYTVGHLDTDDPVVVAGIKSSFLGQYYTRAVEKAFGTNSWDDHRARYHHSGQLKQLN